MLAWIDTRQQPHNRNRWAVGAFEKIEVVEAEDSVEIRFADNASLSSPHVQQAGQQLSEVVGSRRDPTLFRINLENVDFLASEAMGMLIELRERAHSQRHRIRLCNVTGYVFEAFQVTHLDRLFEMEQNCG